MPLAARGGCQLLLELELQVVVSNQCGCWEPNSGPLQEAKPSFPPYLLLKLLTAVVVRTETKQELMLLLRSLKGSWRDGSAVKSIDCSSRGPEFNSQQPHSGSQPSVMESNRDERMDHVETAISRDPPHNQLPNADTIAYTSKILSKGPSCSCLL